MLHPNIRQIGFEVFSNMLLEEAAEIVRIHIKHIRQRLERNVVRIMLLNIFFHLSTLQHFLAARSRIHVPLHKLQLIISVRF
ncbi:hypothetical protein D3C79_1027380 [compost metagenome]